MSCECRACSWTLSGHGTVRAIDAASRPWQLSPAPGFLLSASDAMPPRDVLRLRRDLAFVNVVNGRELHPARRAAHPARRDRRCWRECIDATAPTRLAAEEGDAGESPALGKRPGSSRPAFPHRDGGPHRRAACRPVRPPVRVAGDLTAGSSNMRPTPTEFPAQRQVPCAYLPG